MFFLADGVLFKPLIETTPKEMKMFIEQIKCPVVFQIDEIKNAIIEKITPMGLRLGEVVKGNDYFPALAGKTYEIKDAIKAAGGRFDGDSKSWKFKDYAAVKDFVETL
jgi:hypothetical protein